MKERDLPLGALRAFSVAARTNNLTAAATELGVTHGAVSKQINALEIWLGQPVFMRERRGLVLTPYGKVLADRLGDAMRDITAACEYVRRQRSQTVISVEAPSTFAMYFLVSKLAQFEAENPKVAVWISTRITGQPLDFSSNDVVITRGKFEGSSRLRQSTILFEEQLTVLSSPALLERLPLKEPADVLTHRLITASTRPGHWEAWLDAMGVDQPVVWEGHRFDHQFVAMHAARDGLGSIVCPRNFLGDRLVCPFPDLLVRGEPYFAHLTPRADSRHVERFLEWLRDVCV
jgi:DNA-binding transcriptional LysR family regulator